MTDRRLAFMRNTFLGVTLFSTGQLTAADGQFPYLHVYLNTPNCSAHTAGVMMLGSIDQRCARAVFLPEQGQALRAAMTGTPGLEPNSVAVHTLPTDPFNRSLWKGGSSRFVLGLEHDTIHGTSLDLLFQCADPINARIASVPPGMLRVDGEPAA
jgi:hypothetical protein